MSVVRVTRDCLPDGSGVSLKMNTPYQEEVMGKTCGGAQGMAINGDRGGTGEMIKCASRCLGVKEGEEQPPGPFTLHRPPKNRDAPCFLYGPNCKEGPPPGSWLSKRSP